MTRGVQILAAVLGGVTLLSVWASVEGFGAAQPTTNPPSIREGSVNRGPLSRGHHRTRYFVGGGLHGGK